jgi:hypothetical protein
VSTTAQITDPLNAIPKPIMPQPNKTINMPIITHYLWRVDKRRGFPAEETLSETGSAGALVLTVQHGIRWFSRGRMAAQGGSSAVLRMNQGGAK